MPISKSMTFGFIITSTATSGKDPGQLLRAALSKRKEGAEVGIFLIGDGVYLVSSDPKKEPAATALSAVLKAGAKVFVSKDHLDAAGIASASLPKGALLVDKPYKELVMKVMEEWDRVVVC